MTRGGADPLPLEEEHCSVVEVTEEDIQNSVKFVPSLSAVVRGKECPVLAEHSRHSLPHSRVAAAQQLYPCKPQS